MEDIQMFLLNMVFISSSEVENIYNSKELFCAWKSILVTCSVAFLLFGMVNTSVFVAVFLPKYLHLNCIRLIWKCHSQCSSIPDAKH